MSPPQLQHLDPVNSAQHPQAPRNCTSAQSLLPLPVGFPGGPHFRPPNVHKGVWGLPICDRSEVSTGLGKRRLGVALVGLATQWDFSLIGSLVPSRTR